MSATPSILDELRTQYGAARVTDHDQSDVEGYEKINARLRNAYKWLDKAFSYLDGVKPAIDHRFDVGHGLVFEETRFGRGYVGQHERRIVGQAIDEHVPDDLLKFILGRDSSFLRRAPLAGLHGTPRGS